MDPLLRRWAPYALIMIGTALATVGVLRASDEPPPIQPVVATFGSTPIRPVQLAAGYGLGYGKPTFWQWLQERSLERCPALQRKYLLLASTDGLTEDVFEVFIAYARGVDDGAGYHVIQRMPSCWRKAPLGEVLARVDAFTGEIGPPTGETLPGEIVDLGVDDRWFERFVELFAAQGRSKVAP